MKKVISFLPYTLCVAVVMFVMASCSKDGATGPAGPAGPAGPNGAGGAAGPAGPAGTANVIYSAWTDTLEYFLLRAGSDTIIGELTVPALTADIVNRGEIKVYGNFGTVADPYVIPLPYTTADGGFVDTYFYIGGIDILSNLNMPGLPLRYVLIPGGAAARTANGKTIDWNNYKEVQAYLGLKD